MKTKTEVQEYDSGYRDGLRGLTYIPGESPAYRDGYQAGVAARAAGSFSLDTFLDWVESK